MKKILIALIFFFAFKAHAEDLNHLAAKVNDEVITSKDVNDYCNILRQQFERDSFAVDINPSIPDFEKKALGRLIEEKLVLGAAKEEQKKREEDAKKDEKKSQYRLEAPQGWIEEEFNRASSAYPSRDEFEKSLAENGLNNYLFREHLKDQYLMQYTVEMEVNHNATVAPQEILEFYKKHKAYLKTPPKYELLTAHFYTKADWQKFESLFKAKGIDAAQKEFDATLKPIETSLGRLRKEFAKPLSKTSDGGSFNVGIGDDIYFFYLQKKIPTQAMSYDEAKAGINNFLMGKKFRRKYTSWMKGLREKAYIKTYL